MPFLKSPKLFALLLCVCAIGAPAASAGASSRELAKPDPDAVDHFFDTAPVPYLKIEIAPKEVEAINKTPREYVRGTVREITPGQKEVVYKDVALHLKGAAGSFRGLGDKPALTLNFDKFVPGQTFHSLDKLHLNNSVQDNSYMNENLGGWIFRQAGVPAPRVGNARVWLNERDLGFFVIKEGFDGGFLKHFFKDKAGILYEGSFTDIDHDIPLHLEGKNNLPKEKVEELKKHANARLKELNDAAHEPDPALRKKKLEKILDVDKFFTFMAAESLVAHWDGYCANRNNYRIYDDPRLGKFLFLPQGMDQLFQRPDHPLIAQAGFVAAVLTQTADDRAAYIDRVAEMRKTSFDQQSIFKRLDEVAAHLQPVMEKMGPDAVKRHKEETAALKQKITERIQNIDRQIAQFPRPIKFDSAGVALLSNWEPKQESDKATADRVDEAGKPRLRVTCKDGGGVASWRSTVILTQGHYTFEGELKTIAAKIAEGQNTGAGLRISGAKNRPAVSGDTNWQRIAYDFEVTQPTQEVVLVCDFKATSGQALFDPATLKLKRKS